MVTYQPGQNIAAVYDRPWYIDIILEMSEDCEDVKTKLMQRVGRRPISGIFSWPQHDNVSWILFHHILCTVPAPEAPWQWSTPVQDPEVDIGTYILPV